MSDAPKKYKAPNLETFIKSKLRQASLRWPPRSEALKRARRQRGKYECAYCLNLFSAERIHLDHIEPVVPLAGAPLRENGKIDFNIWIERLFCTPEQFQALCTECHNAKTAREDSMRSFYNQKKKVKKNAK